MQYQTRQDARSEDALVAACRGELGHRGPRPYAGAHGHRPLHRSSALRVDLEPARQHRRAHRRGSRRQHEAFPFTTNPDRYKPATVTGAGATSFELNVTDPDFKFPQVWRTNLAVDHRLPGGVTGTVEFLYNKDINGVYYINANLPAAQTTFSGVDARPRWCSTAIPHQQHSERHHQRVCAEEPGHRLVVEPLGQSLEDAVPRIVAPRRLQLRRGEEHDRPGLHGLFDLRQQPALGGSKQPRPRVRRTRRDIACSCRRRTRSSTSASARRRCRRSGKRSRRSRTSPRRPATCSTAT